MRSTKKNNTHPTPPQEVLEGQSYNNGYCTEYVKPGDLYLNDEKQSNCNYGKKDTLCNCGEARRSWDSSFLKRKVDETN